LKIAEEHPTREEVQLGQANRYLFTDTNALTTAVFVCDIDLPATTPGTARVRSNGWCSSAK
jgi:hypothetical protein